MSVSSFYACAVAGVLLLAGCASESAKRADFFTPSKTSADIAKQNRRPKAPSFSRAQAEVEICDAVVRRFVQDASTELKTPVNVVYLALSTARTDPEAAFLKRFTERKLRVLPASKAPRSSANGVLAQSSEDHATLLTIQSLTWIDYEHVQVSSSWSADGVKELVFQYQIARKGKKWSVI